MTWAAGWFSLDFPGAGSPESRTGVGWQGVVGVSVYERLMDGVGEDFDRHVLAAILAIGATEAPLPLTCAVGLDAGQLARLLDSRFPGCADLVPADADRGEDALEEADLRRLLMEKSTDPTAELTAWLAAMVARRALRPRHLWQDLGLGSRAELSRLMQVHFAPLAALNDRDMKWKKFFYRQLCEDEGVLICKSPICDTCSDYPVCFGPEH